MHFNGKIVGVILGYLVGGPLGLLIGLIVGQFYDAGAFRQWAGSNVFSGFSDRKPGEYSGVQAAFFEATFACMGFIAKSDGRISEREIKAAERVMQQMELKAEARARAIDAFNRGKASGFDIDGTLAQLKRTCWHHPSLLKFFLETQIQMAYADGRHLSPQARAALQRICQHLGLSTLNFDQFEQRYRAEQSYQRQRQYQSGPGQHRARSSISEAYTILGVAERADDATVKKAYRKLMSENHPDRLIAKGVPAEMIKMATQKTVRIKQAYEDIKAHRGMH